MKTFTKFSLIIFFGLLANTSFAQSKDTTMVVNGVCGMCREVIESAANDLEGVEKAAWNKDTKILSLSYETEKLSLKDISNAVNASGYDTEYNTAPDEAYYGLHKCCYYRDPEVVEQHENE